jgi:phytoene dehydrogenase-like protein
MRIRDTRILPRRDRPSTKECEGTLVTPSCDVVVIGSGPNGLAAANALADAGLSVEIVERDGNIGGGTRSEALTLPGFLHDVCSAVHPLGVASPYFRTLGLERHGLEWIHPPCPVVHVMPDGGAVALERSVDDAAAALGDDGPAYARLVRPYTRRSDTLMRMILGPLRFPIDPLLLAGFGLSGIGSARALVHRRLHGHAARALMAGIAAHAMLPLDRPPTAAFLLVLAIAAHSGGWPIARGGSKAIGEALLARLRSKGASVTTAHDVQNFDELAAAKPARAYVFDVTPRQLVAIAGYSLPASYRSRLARYRYGAGVCKVDWALSEPIPWLDPGCARSATVHLSGTWDDVAEAEAAVHRGAVSARPFVLLVQPSLFDASRAPAGRHTAWAYCHVPHASDIDASDAIEAQVERAAPGFRRTIVGRSVRTTSRMERENPNYVGGDINGGIADLAQLFFRPAVRVDPYSTPDPRIFLCSSSTPPGGGVHGMCGYWAAQSVLRRVFGKSSSGA